MRLTTQQIVVLKDSLKRLDPSAKLYLFGSRVDDQRKGGDIDLLIESKKLQPADVRRLRLDFYRHFGEQKIDIVLDDGRTNAFVAKIRTQAVEL